MLTPTHLLTAQTTYFATCIAVGHAPQPLEALLALAAALLPDLDSRQSYVGRLLHPVSSWFEDSFGHRTLTHSLLAQTALGIAAYFALPFGFFLAFVSGWVSHSIADMMTPSGVAWFWPSRIRCVLPGNARYRMEVMGKDELWFIGIMGISGLLLLPLASTGQSTTGLIRSAIGDIATARKEYDARKGDYAFYLKLKGRDNRSFENVSGRYYVIGPYEDNGFILETGAGPVSVCQTAACDWYAEHTILNRESAQITTSISIELDRIKMADLISKLEAYQRFGQLYLLGSASTTVAYSAPPTLKVTGDQLIFNYTSLHTLASTNMRSLRNVVLSVQIRHSTGTKITDPKLPQSSADSSLEAILKRWLPSR